MTDDERAKLRTLAEEAKRTPFSWTVTGDAESLDVGDDFLRAASPDVVLGLLDALDKQSAALREFDDWQSVGPKGCPPYTSTIAGALDRLDRSFAALREVEEMLRADLARCCLQRDQTAEVLRKAQIEAGEDGNPIGVTKLLAERDEALATIEREREVHGLVKRSGTLFLGEIGDWKAAHAEALAEIAAYQGRPEGALNEHWRYARALGLWQRDDPPMRIARNQETLRWNWSVTAPTQEWTKGESGRAESPRSAMRAAEAAAKARGWLQ